MAKKIPRDKRRQQAGDAIARYLQSLTKEQLVERLWNAARHDEGLWDQLQAECQFEPVADSADELIGWARQAIAAATRPGSEYGGDFGAVAKYLKQLVAAGQADVVLELGRDLYRRGVQQVEMSDEGLMCSAIDDCMTVVFDALSQSSLPVSRQMLWAWEVGGHDGYCLCDKAHAKFWKRKFKAADWSQFADALLTLLQTPVEMPKTKRRGYQPAPPRNVRREKDVKQAIAALVHAGREAEVAAVYRGEAERRGEYLPLVDYLLEQGRSEDARQAITAGLQTLARTGRPHMIPALQDRFAKLAQTAHEPLAVVQVRADQFAAQPALATYRTLREAAQQAGLWERFKPYVFRFLAGSAPAAPDAGPGRLPEWPLTAARHPLQTPLLRANVALFIEIACDENEPDQALQWYGRLPRGRFDVPPYGLEDRLAQSVVATHPDQAVAIWRNLADRNSDVSRPGQYGLAADYLMKIRRTLTDLGRDANWLQQLDAFRQQHGRKPKLLGLVAKMADGPVKREAPRQR
jgi:uncharacterized Zn finger protein